MITVTLTGKLFSTEQTWTQFGIGEDRAVNYISDSEGTILNHSVMSNVVSEFRENATISYKHFNKIREDIKKRGGNK